ncbi:MAG TPA: hypothetical protein GXZ87_10795 [Bacteroidales bacterium]|nr:hypothetical protein [Bacteroidales bacterium]
MKLEDYIDDFIRKEKQQQVNPYLATRVLAKLDETETIVPIRKKAPVWQSLAVAASLALIVVMRIEIGSMAKMSQNNYASLNINDAQLENLNLYKFDDYE